MRPIPVAVFVSDPLLFCFISFANIDKKIETQNYFERKMRKTKNYFRFLSFVPFPLPDSFVSVRIAGRMRCDIRPGARSRMKTGIVLLAFTSIRIPVPGNSMPRGRACVVCTFGLSRAQSRTQSGQCRGAENYRKNFKVFRYRPWGGLHG